MSDYYLLAGTASTTNSSTCYYINKVNKLNNDTFLSCSKYENVPCEKKWEKIKGNDRERQFEIAQKASTRKKLRRIIIGKFEAGHPLNPPGSRAPGSC